jgi:hypothetical protein
LFIAHPRARIGGVNVDSLGHTANRLPPHIDAGESACLLRNNRQPLVQHRRIEVIEMQVVLFFWTHLALNRFQPSCARETTSRDARSGALGA